MVLSALRITRRHPIPVTYSNKDFIIDYLLFVVKVGANFQVFTSDRTVFFSGLAFPKFVSSEIALRLFFQLKFETKIFSFSIVIVVY